jgi:hypothetical protein
MNKILFLALAIAIAVAGLAGLITTQEVHAHCDGIGNCNGIQGSGSGGSGDDSSGNDGGGGGGGDGN